MRLEYQGRLERWLGQASITSLKGQLCVGYHVFMQLCIKLYYGRVTKKIFKPKFRRFKNVMALFQYICKHAAVAILSEITGTTQEDHQMLVVCTIL
jgi:hypothetical protein